MANKRSSIVVDTSKASARIDQVLRQSSPAAIAGYMASVAAPHFEKTAEARFDKSGDNASGAWEKLAEATRQIRVNLGFTDGTGPGEINVRSGVLRDWLVHAQVVIAQDAAGTTLEWPGPNPSASVRTRLEQAYGNRRGPARPVVAYDLSDVSYLTRTMQSFIMTGKAGR